MRRALAVVLAFELLTAGAPGQASLWPSAEVRVERELTDNDVLVRRAAALELGTLPRAAAHRLALAALGDGDPEVRMAALRVATASGSEDLGGRLATWLSEPDTRLRQAAAEALAARPSAAALAALGRASSDADARVRAAVARALGAAASPDAVLPLLGRLDDPAPDVRREVVSALGRLGDRRAVVPLLAKVQDPAGVVRRATARSLGLLGDPRAGSALVLVLRDPDPEVRVAALDAVGRLRDKTAVSSIVAALADHEPHVRAAAANALARLDTPAALAALLTELGREDADAEPIVAALVLAGDAALPALRACLETRAGSDLVEGCARALGELGDPSDGARLRALLEHHLLTPLVALPALARLGGSDAVPVALEALASADAAVRQSATLALAELMDPSHPDGRAVEPLLQALRARDATLAEQSVLVRLLGRTGEPRVGAELARIAKESTPPELVASALRALGDIGQGPWEELLLAKLDDEDGGVRMAAALTLRRTASPRASGPLLERLLHAAEQDRLALGVALPGAARTADRASFGPRLLGLWSRARDGERDALLEAWAELDLPVAPEALDAADRRKLAEVVTGARSHTLLLTLARDADARVRANAAWSLGQSAAAEELDFVARLVTDRDAMVAANAASALGRAGARLARDVSPLLCPLLGDARAVVRQSAAAGLGLAGRGCAPGLLEHLLGADPAARVRRAVARTLASQPPGPERDAALERCSAEEPNVEVAAACALRSRVKSSASEPLLVFVVPTGATVPVAGAPFALRLADGTERFGVADRRGAVVERLAPAGAVELGVLPVAGE